MRRVFLALGAFSLAIPVAMTVTGGAGIANARTYSGSSRVYKNCRHSSGTTGLIAGGVGGAILGSKIIGGGIVGPIVGAAGGALGGRAIDRSITAKKRCTYVRRR